MSTRSNAGLAAASSPQQVFAYVIGQVPGSQTIGLGTVGIGHAISFTISGTNSRARSVLGFTNDATSQDRLIVNYNGSIIPIAWRVDPTNPASQPLIEQFQIYGYGGDDYLGFVQGPDAVDVSALGGTNQGWVGVLDGGPGNDTLVGSSGNDQLMGGPGRRRSLRQRRQ